MGFSVVETSAEGTRLNNGNKNDKSCSYKTSESSTCQEKHEKAKFRREQMFASGRENLQGNITRSSVRCELCSGKASNAKHYLTDTDEMIDCTSNTK